jgi:hypothetical protein
LIRPNGSGPDGERKGAGMLDIAYFALTIAVFGLVVAVLKGVEKL